MAYVRIHETKQRSRGEPVKTSAVGSIGCAAMTCLTGIQSVSWAPAVRRLRARRRRCAAAVLVLFEKRNHLATVAQDVLVERERGMMRATGFEIVELYLYDESGLKQSGDPALAQQLADRYSVPVHM